MYGTDHTSGRLKLAFWFFFSLWGNFTIVTDFCVRIIYNCSFAYAAIKEKKHGQNCSGLGFYNENFITN